MIERTRGVQTHRRTVRFAVVAALLGVFVLPGCLPSPPPDACESGEDPAPVFAVTQAPGLSCEPPPPCVDCGGGSGDPHITTHDGLRYDFHTAAEVVATRSSDGRFEVQWRQESLGASQTAGITAVAALIDGTRVSVVGATEEVRVDGDVIDVSDGDVLLLPLGVTVHRTGRQVLVADADLDAAVHIQLSTSAMSVLVDPPEAERGSLAGLLGDGDGDRSDDVVLADGTVLAEPDWDTVHPELGEAWRVTDDNTLFDYEAGLGPDDYWDPTFPTRQPRLDDFTDAERAEAEEICRAAGVTDEAILEECIYDVLVTGDATLADAAALLQQARTGASPGGVDPDQLVDRLTGTWDTTYGEMTFAPGGEGMTGRYSGEDGTLDGSFDGLTYEGTWAEPSSAQVCETTIDDTEHWGRFSFTFDADLLSFTGTWGYCDGPLDAGWTGERVAATGLGGGWVALLPGRDPQRPLVASGTVFVQAPDQNGPATLTALDAGSGDVRWTLAGVDARCGVGVSGTTLFAMAERGGALAGPDGAPAIVAIDTASGQTRAERYDPDREAGERAIDACDTPLIVTDELVIHVLRNRLNAFGLDDLSPAWELILPQNTTLGPFVADGIDDALWLGWHDDDDLVVALVDTVAGSIEVTTATPGRSAGREAGVAGQGGDLVLSYEVDGEPFLSRVRGSGSAIDEVWTAALADDDRALVRMAVAGDTVAGYTDGSLITAFAIDDGARQWSAQTTSFNNNGRAVAGDPDGNVYVGSFGGAYLESYDPDGARRWEVGLDDVSLSGVDIGAPLTIGPLADGLVLVTSSSGSLGVSVVAVPVDGPGG